MKTKSADLGDFMNCRNDSHALYRHYDKDGRLLYVGITNDPGKRWEQHRNKDWWHDVTRTDIERFPDRESVSMAELDAIRNEKPWWNERHNEDVVQYRTRARCAATLIGERLAHVGLSKNFITGLRKRVRAAAELGLKAVNDSNRDEKIDTPSMLASLGSKDEQLWFYRGFRTSREIAAICKEWDVMIRDAMYEHDANRSFGFVVPLGEDVEQEEMFEHVVIRGHAAYEPEEVFAL